MAEIEIMGNERVLLAGKTGSGKTHLGLTLLMTVPRLMVVDLKGTIDPEVWNLEEDTDNTLMKFEAGKPIRIRVRSIDRGITYIRAALESGGVIIYLDEVYAFLEGEAKAEAKEAVNAVWTRGRELGIGGWAATQRPVSLPLSFMTEAEWFFVFRLKLPEDRERMRGVMGTEEVMDPVIDEHGFYVMREDWDSPAYYKKLDTSLTIEVETEAVK